MSFAVYGSSAGDFEGVDLAGGRPGLGFYQLKFTTRFRMWPRNGDQALTMDIEGGEVLAKNPTGSTWFLMGRLHREAGIPRSTAVEGRPVFAWELALDLPPAGLEAIERVRSGGELDLQIVVSGRTRKGNGESEDGRDIKQIRVNQSEWAALLAQIGYRETLLLEVAVLDSEKHPDLAEAVERLREAREEFQRGQYRKTVEACRHVLEALGHELGDGTGNTANLRAMIDRSSELPKDERLLIMRRSAFVMACLAAHSKDQVSIRTTWDRHDALGLLTVTAGMVHWIAGNRQAGHAK